MGILQTEELERVELDGIQEEGEWRKVLVDNEIKNMMGRVLFSQKRKRNTVEVSQIFLRWTGLTDRGEFKSLCIRIMH